MAVSWYQHSQEERRNRRKRDRLINNLVEIDYDPEEHKGKEECSICLDKFYAPDQIRE